MHFTTLVVTVCCESHVDNEFQHVLINATPLNRLFVKPLPVITIIFLSFSGLISSFFSKFQSFLLARDFDSI